MAAIQVCLLVCKVLLKLLDLYQLLLNLVISNTLLKYASRVFIGIVILLFRDWITLLKEPDSELSPIKNIATAEANFTTD